MQVKKQKIILVPGQVDDDASIKFGGSGMTSQQMLKKVREENPDDYIIFKPHPDVVTGLRKGLRDKETALHFANAYIEDQTIEVLIEIANEIHTISSLSGFEALIRGKKVVCYGLPFYAGWGLTSDKTFNHRRNRKLKLEELVAATLILYPRYFDPISQLPCPPELVIERIRAEKEALLKKPFIVFCRELLGAIIRRFD